MTSAKETTTTPPTNDCCPYAAALQIHFNGEHQHDEESNHQAQQQQAQQQHQQQKQPTDGPTTQDLLMVTRQKCPAFANANGCPFKNANPNQVKEKLLSIPSSHYEMSSFLQVLQGLHTTSSAVSSANGSEQFQLPGGCPVPATIKSRVGGFRQVLEEMSLAAVMAEMAREFELEDEEGEEDSSDDFRPPPTAEEDTKPAPFEQQPQEQDQPEVPSVKEEPARRTSLSQCLKTGTARAHEAAENVHFVKNFVRGQIDRRLYGNMVASLLHVYQTLEQALDQHAPTHFGTCHFATQLNRTEALKDDVEFWHGHHNNNNPPISPATLDYMKRIQDIAQREPILLLAHSYTRYLGDLSGGKVLARVARRALHLDRNPDDPKAATEGLAFYHFDAISSAKLFKDQYRQALDDLPLTATQVQRLVQEANVAFLLNVRLFEELDVAANVPNAVVRPLEDVLRVGPDGSSEDPHHNHHHSGEGEDKCPFLMEKKAKGVTAPVSHDQQQQVHKKGRCPWPFIVFHDPIQFVRDWQTWALLGVLLCILWSFAK